MNTTQRLKYLKKELKNVKKFLDTNPDMCFGDYKKGNAAYYNIIMKDGTWYIVGITTYDFPNINFKNIRYIDKSIRRKSTYYNIYKGEFSIGSNFEYFNSLYKKLNAKTYIATGKEY